jgi:hypothetical protein
MHMGLKGHLRSHRTLLVGMHAFPPNIDNLKLGTFFMEFSIHYCFGFFGASVIVNEVCTFLLRGLFKSPSFCVIAFHSTENSSHNSSTICFVYFVK